MSEAIDGRILEELVQIRKLLTVLSQDKLKEFNNYIESEYLTTNQRKQMYELMDGDKSNADIAKIVHVTTEAVRLFVVQLEKAGLIEFVEINGRQKNAKRLF